MTKQGPVPGPGEFKDVPQAPTVDKGMSVAERIAALRAEALAEVETATNVVKQDSNRLAGSKRKQRQAVATALDAGVEVQDVATAAGVSEGTVRSWAKGDEGT